MRYWIKRKTWQIKNLISWLPIIWNQSDNHSHFAIEVFKFQLQKVSIRLNSKKAYHLDSKDSHKRLEMILKLMTKVYDDDYGMEYIESLNKIYGEELFEYKFIPCEEEGYSELKYSYELTETPERVEEITNLKNKLFKESIEKQKRAHKLLWDLIEHNIQNMWS